MVSSPNLGFQILGSQFRVRDLGFRILGLCCRA